VQDGHPNCLHLRFGPPAKLVDQVFAADEVQTALRSLETGSHFGKLCLTF
jgi:hypothetical protein